MRSLTSIYACCICYSQVHSLEKAQVQMPTLNEVVSQCKQVLHALLPPSTLLALAAHM